MKGLASKNIHEIFHAFQRKNKESREPKELEALASDFDPEAFTDIPFADGMLQGIAPAGTLPEADEALVKQLKGFHAETEALIEKTLEKNEVLLEGDYPLVSPNVYDARYRAPYMISRFFVAYRDENEETQVIREQMLLIETDGNLSIKKVYRA